MTGSSAIVIVTAHDSPAATTSRAFVSFAVSGASTLAGQRRARADHDQATEAGSAMHYVTGLTPGDNTFTLQYRVAAAAAPSRAATSW